VLLAVGGFCILCVFDSCIYLLLFSLLLKSGIVRHGALVIR
jgi:hypothetical protein